MTPEISAVDGQSSPSKGGESSTLEEMKAFLHARNKTGVIGDVQWHDDIKVHELWDKLSVPESSGNRRLRG